MSRLDYDQFGTSNSAAITLYLTETGLASHGDMNGLAACKMVNHHVGQAMLIYPKTPHGGGSMARDGWWLVLGRELLEENECIYVYTYIWSSE